jgi:branched-chain amino acid transport system permease protein
MNAYQLGLIMMACISIINVAGVFAMTSLGGMFSLGQVAYMAIGSYVTFVLAWKFKIPVPLSGLIAVITGALAAWIISIPTLKLRRDYFALLSVAFGQMVISLIIMFPDYTNGSIGFSKIPKIPHLFILVLAITALTVFCVRNLKFSRFGRMLIALKTDEITARSFGIDVYRLKIKTYILASIIAALAGILYGMRNRVIGPEAFGWAQSAEMQIFLFFGGTNSLTGSVIAAFFLKLLPEVFRGVKLFGQSLQEYRTVIYCLLIILVINFRQQGILGERELNYKGGLRAAGKLIGVLGKLITRFRGRSHE